MDNILERMEEARIRLTEAKGSIVRRPQTELDLLRYMEDARDLMTAVLRDDSRDRGTLRQIFGGDCTRVSRVRAVLEAVSLSEMNACDQRAPGCLRACESIEQVLRGLGLDNALRDAQLRLRSPSTETCEGPVDAQPVPLQEGRRERCTCELKVELLSASQLQAPQYDFSDLLFSALGGAPWSAPLSAVRVEIILGQVRATTATYEALAGSISFTDEPFVFAYRDESAVFIRALDLRTRGGTELAAERPIGEVEFVLASEPRNYLPPRSAELELLRNGATSGTLTLRYQFCERCPIKRLDRSAAFIGRVPTSDRK